jgi:hypothetical protein
MIKSYKYITSFENTEVFFFGNTVQYAVLFTGRHNDHDRMWLKYVTARSVVD